MDAPLRILATLRANDPNFDTQKIEFGHDSRNNTTSVVLTSKSNRKQTKSYPMAFSPEQGVIDALAEYEQLDGYTLALSSDDLKAVRISWMATPMNDMEVERMVKILNALSGQNIDPDPAQLVSMAVVCSGLVFALSKVVDDVSLSTTFWAPSLTHAQAACLACFGSLKVTRTDDLGKVHERDSTLAQTITTAARLASLGNEVDARLESIGIGYKPFDLTKIAASAGTSVVDF